MLTQEKLKSIVSYSKETGEFIKFNLNNKSHFGWMDEKGYPRCKIEGKAYRLHRLAWLYEYGVLPEKFIDHIDGNPKNNRISNLRECNNSENLQNQVLARKDNCTGFLGVRKVGGIYAARIGKVGHARKHLGCFDTPEEAHQAYLIAKRELHEFCTI